MYIDERMDQDWKRKLVPKIRKFLKDYGATATFSIQRAIKNKFIDGGFVVTLNSGEMFFPKSFNGERFTRSIYAKSARLIKEVPLPKEQYDFLDKLLEVMAHGHHSINIVQIGKEHNPYKHKPWCGYHYPKGLSWIDTI